MTLRIPVALACLVCAVAAPPASAATFFVNQSAPLASDGHPCTNRRGPCLTIGAAVNKAKATAGNSVRVLGDPNGTPDTYNETVVLTGEPIELRGAGSELTVVVSPGAIHNVATTSTVRDIAFNTALSAVAGSTLERVKLSSTGQIAYTGAATVRDSLILGPSNSAVAAAVSGGRLVRSTVVGASGIRVLSASLDLLDVTIRQSLVSGGTGLTLASDAGNPATVRARHLTIMEFQTRVSLGFGTSFQASDSTIAGPPGTTDLAVVPQSGASFSTTNFSSSRTTFSSGAQPFQVQASDPVDVDPGFLRDGHLAPGSLLIDRGTAGGVLAGDPDDALDIDRAPRVQSVATDVGSDETGSAAPVPPPDGGEVPDAPGAGAGGGGGGGAGGASDRTPASLTQLKVPSSFHAVCPRPRPGRRRCVVGLLITYRLSEAAKVQFSFKRRRRGSRAVLITRQASAGKVTWRFSGKVGRRALPKAVYDLTISTTDLAGNRSRAIRRVVTVI